MEIDTWICGYKVRSFPWVDRKTIYFNVQYYCSGQSLSKPPAWDKTVYITNDAAGRDMVENFTASLAEHVANMAIPVGRKVVITAERSLKI